MEDNLLVGKVLESLVVLLVGKRVEVYEGTLLGVTLGIRDGLQEGIRVEGFLLEIFDGLNDGNRVGIIEGLLVDGNRVGIIEGFLVDGNRVGDPVGLRLFEQIIMSDNEFVYDI